MKKPVTISLALVAMALAVGLVAAVAAPILYQDVTIAGGQTASVIPRVADGSSASIADDMHISGEWKVSAGSTAGYQFASAEGAALTGTTDSVSGALTITDDTLSAAAITVDVDSLSCGNAQADRYLRNVALQADDFPTATFELDQPIDVALSAVAGQIQTVTGRGTLTLHGVSHEVNVQLQTTFGATGARISGSIPISLADYDVTGPDFGFAVGDGGATVQFAVNAVKG
ncbi:YceI family protein [Subtercola endophyticus]|uniref:YceI family protein n=1 Tax=Subtercola endophyticus TaxID=2895559 RepID=UPI001E35F79C|nr:YceI family protein [Subtercola endophyticus]UFS60007.1 YceI family protein [Subtercola endophyticus]